MSKVTNQREISGFVCVGLGNYVVVPSTNKPELTGPFTITIYYPIKSAGDVSFSFSDTNAKGRSNIIIKYSNVSAKETYAANSYECIPKFLGETEGRIALFAGY